jgi:hypothetical protein
MRPPITAKAKNIDHAGQGQKPSGEKRRSILVCFRESVATHTEDTCLRDHVPMFLFFGAELNSRCSITTTGSFLVKQWY